MAQTYEQFKTYILSLSWRQNDADLVADLDTIILAAHAELDRKLGSLERREEIVVLAPTVEDFDLSADAPDFKSVVSLTNNNWLRSNRAGLGYSKVTKNKLYHARQLNNQAVNLDIYATTTDESTGNKFLLFVAPEWSVASPGDLTLVYKTEIPDYATEDASWLEDEYLDLYQYAVLKHIGVYLREDDRIKLYNELMTDALTSVLEDDEHNQKWGGADLHMRPHRPIPTC